MYESLYHFAADPFRLSPDQRFSFQHPSYIKAKAYLRYALNRAEGFVMITGSPGSGKTTLLDDLLANIDSQHTVIARLVTTQLGANDLLRMVAYGFRLRVEGLDKATVLRQLEEYLMQEYRSHHRALLIIDEAQDLEGPAMEEMRLLTNLRMNNLPLLQVFLVGQENLLAIVQHSAMEQLHQRMIASSHLEPLSADETADYVLHRLRVAGWHQDPQLSLGALRRIHLFSGGVPRRINQLCSRLLLYGAMEEKHTLTSKDVQEVIGELRQEQLVPNTDVDPPEGSLEADDAIMASGPADNVRPEPPRRTETQAPERAETGSTPWQGMPSRRQGQALAEDIRHDEFALVEGETQTSARSRPVPPLTLIQGAATQASEPAADDHEDPPLSGEAPRANPAAPLDDRRWSLQNDDSKVGFIAIAAISVGLLLGALFLMSAQRPAASAVNVATPTAPAASTMPVRRDDRGALRDLVAKGLPGEVQIVKGNTPAQLLLQVNSDMQFELGDEAMTPALAATLTSLAAMLQKFPQAAIRVIGHCDVSGSNWRNQVLSERRARVVSAFLAQQGIAPQRLRAEGRGNSELRSLTDQGLNRRVDLAIDFSPPPAVSGQAITQPADAADFHADFIAGF